MIEVHFASIRENSTTGWSIRLVRESDVAPSKNSAYSRKNGTLSKSGTTDDAYQTLFNLITKIDVSQDLRIFVHVKDRVFQNSDGFNDLPAALRERGHENVVVIAFGKDYSSSDDPDTDYDAFDLNKELYREARAAAWGVRMNPKGYVPGPTIDSEEAQEIHKLANMNGWSKGAFRLFLAEYGLISANEITEAIVDRVKQRLYSGTIAEMYNDKYNQLPDV